MTRLTLASFALALLVSGRSAHAQPGAEPTSGAPVAVPSSGPKNAVEETSEPIAPETQALFDAANDALISNKFDDAISMFDRIAATSTNPDLRGAATAMADLARRLKESKAYITVGGAGRGGVLASPDKESGRTSLVITTTLAAFYSSFALVDILGVDDFTPISLTVAATTAAGLGLSLYSTTDAAISPSTASAYSTGLIAGVANGLLLAPKVGIDPDGEFGDGEVNQNYLLFGLTTMAAGGAAGYLLGKRQKPTEGQVTTTSMAGLTGFASTGLLLAMVQPDGIDGDTVAAMLALGMDAGLAGGALFTKDIDWSPSRANYVALSQFLGALAGFTAGAIVVGEPDDGDERVYAGLVLGGIWGGLAAGIHFTDHMAPDVSMASKAQVQLAPMIGVQMQGLALAGQF